MTELYDVRFIGNIRIPAESYKDASTIVQKTIEAICPGKDVYVTDSWRVKDYGE
jgi:hypothetical protein